MTCSTIIILRYLNASIKLDYNESCNAIFHENAINDIIYYFNPFNRAPWNKLTIIIKISRYNFHVDGTKNISDRKIFWHAYFSTVYQNEA